MNTNGKNLFGDLDDFDNEPASSTAYDREADEQAQEMFANTKSSVEGAKHVEPCNKCNGTGSFHSYTGRYVGQCFTCKGTGTRTFKQSKETREHNRKMAAERKVKKAVDALQKFKTDHPAENAWLDAACARNYNFAQSLVLQLSKKGSLSKGQMDAIREGIKRDEAYQAKKAEGQKPAVETAGLKSLLAAFDTARENGLKKPVLHIGTLKISLAPAHGANANHLYVKSSGTYVGKITPAGQFLKGRDCTPEDIELIEAIGENPFEQALDHGRITGQCSCCGRELTNQESIDLGIGPICRSRWGW